jgi:hypothetical protein
MSFPAALECGSEDIRGGVISNLQVKVLEQDRAKATFVLSGMSTRGIPVSRHEGNRLRLAGRVPFGPQRRTVVNEQTFDLPKAEGRPLGAGRVRVYPSCLRARKAEPRRPDRHTFRLRHGPIARQSNGEPEI